MPKVSEKKYRAQKYRKEWEKESWASSWLSMSKRVNGKAYCTLCDKDLVAGKSELVGHSKSSGHLRQSKTSQDSHHMRVFFAMTNASTINAELNTAALIARKNIPFNALDILYNMQSELKFCVFNIAQPCGWYPGPSLWPARSDVVELVGGYGDL